MQHKIGADDFKAANRLMRQQEELGWWEVCDEYEIRNGKIVAKHPFRDSTGRQRWRIYWPLQDTPDLFLKLATTYEAPEFSEATLVFSHKYGVLGGSSIRRERNYVEMSLSQWWEEAERAWVILKLYEAARNRDGDAVERLHAKYDGTLLEALTPDLIKVDEKHPERNWRVAQFGVINSTILVQRTVQLLCRPALAFGSEDDPFRVTALWEFDNLLGALYLQMYWLMASGDDLGRCENCDRPISLARTQPQGRKRRRDKRFCDDACRQAHHRSKKKG